MKSEQSAWVGFLRQRFCFYHKAEATFTSESFYSELYFFQIEVVDVARFITLLTAWLLKRLSTFVGAFLVQFTDQYSFKTNNADLYDLSKNNIM